jgi:hypothetical protein
LYRGIRKGKVSDECKQVGSKGYWPSPSSTSASLEVAKEYAGEGGTIFEIHLNSEKPHPHINLNNGEWSDTPSDHEILLLPYFELEVTKVENREDLEAYIIVK